MKESTINTPTSHIKNQRKTNLLPVANLILTTIIHPKQRRQPTNIRLIHTSVRTPIGTLHPTKRQQTIRPRLSHHIHTFFIIPAHTFKIVGFGTSRHVDPAGYFVVEVAACGGAGFLGFDVSEEIGCLI
jgi:hypothetical protein